MHTALPQSYCLYYSPSFLIFLIGAGASNADVLRCCSRDSYRDLVIRIYPLHGESELAEAEGRGGARPPLLRDQAPAARAHRDSSLNLRGADDLALSEPDSS